MTKTLTGKVALVTGGSRGIGAAIARRLAEHGADVAISYAASADKAEAVVRELKANGVRAAAFRADQAEPAQVQHLVDTVVERLGRLDILVNSAGVYVTGTVGDPATDSVAIQRQFAVNVGGVASAVRAAVPVMGVGGRIISIGSVAGSHVPWPGMADYAATKAAVAGYTRGWARDLGSKGYHCQYRAAGSDRHRHEPGRRRVCRGAESGHGAWPLWQARRDCCRCRLFGKPGRRFHHRNDARCRRRLLRMNMRWIAGAAKRRSASHPSVNLDPRHSYPFG